MFIESHEASFGVAPICTVLSEHGCPIAPSTYYEARHRSLSKRAARDEDLKVKISAAHKSNLEIGGRCIDHQGQENDLWVGLERARQRLAPHTLHSPARPGSARWGQLELLAATGSLGWLRPPTSRRSRK